jgi:uncharacterized FlgJ-related protein
MKKLLLCIFLVTAMFASAKTPTHREVYEEIVKAGIMYPEIAYAQAVLESGAFRSKLAKVNKNLFGMRMPKYRNTTATGKKHGYATYKNWKQSVADYKLWQSYLFKKKQMTVGDFKRYLNRVYSESKNYTAKLNLIIKINKNKYEEDSIYASNGCANDSVRIIL